MMPERFFSKDCHEPSEIIGYKHKSDIGFRPGDKLFCQNITESPLSFYRAVGVFDNGLPSLVKGPVL